MTAPGTDQIDVELYKALPDEGLKAMVEIMKEVWIQNNPPDEWLQTLQFPIPKKTNPKEVQDYRRITLCQVSYRIYTKFLLKKMEETVKDPGTYQAAFLRNRSTDDHMLVVRRILEEEWRAGNKLYVIALDLEKAFDTVSLEVAAKILASSGMPIYLVNRIIKTCMWERTSLKWFGQITKMVIKGIGVKQGCPVSPRVFNMVLDEVLKTLEDIYPEINLNQDNELKLPVILAYADDIIILANNLNTTSVFINELVELLVSVGLKVNFGKSEALIRYPGKDNQDPRVLKLGNIELKGSYTA